MIRGRVLPLVRMKELLGISNESETIQRKKREFVVVVGIADKRIGIIADKTIGNQEIVIKSLGSYIGAPPYISGATIMGDGNMLPVIDLRKRFNLPEVKQTKKSRVIVVENGTEDIGFLVDEVTQVIKVNQLSIELPQEEHYYNSSKLIKGVSKLGDRVVLILDFDEILSSIKLDYLSLSESL